MVVCLFVLLQHCLILANFFLIEALIKLRKILLRRKLLDVQLGSYLSPRVQVIASVASQNIGALQNIGFR